MSEKKDAKAEKDEAEKYQKLKNELVSVQYNLRTLYRLLCIMELYTVVGLSTSSIVFDYSLINFVVVTGVHCI